MQILSPRAVPLGGLRAMTVRRTLPQRQRTFVGAWCFVDHYGPDQVNGHGGMVVPPHPHTGLQTVSWLFSGEIEHRDSAGHQALVIPGEVNLMTAGRGISHSEYSTSGTTTLHGAQLWLALPDSARHTEPTFEHFAPDPIGGNGWEARVFLGSLLGSSSPVRTFTPLLGAELRLRAGTVLRIPVDPAFEHGILLDSGALTVNGEKLAVDDLGYLEPGAEEIELVAGEDVLLLLLGGTPFGEQIVMWWNFIGRSHEEVVEYRTQWQSLIEGDGSDRFSMPPGDLMPPIPAPVLPNVRMVRRG
ncbi:pirin family protein [Nocardioides marmoriginsengisoli]|uniref:Pirin family protein n=1 Tax=Nocardioides marmoriginsengisoli TaxID=661483 RepID=A0A3N0CCE6_9ACTN|nr:pirin family protein [Nocardioides marmoriginsengisoli]RNL61108.1 pirin family protein [Nocardioides marmoriginsengisoli]